MADRQEGKPRISGKRSISRTLATYLVVLVTIIFVVTNAISFLVRSYDARNDYQQEAQENIGYLRESVALPLWNLDTNTIQGLCGAFVSNDTVAVLEVLDENGEEFYAYKSEEYLTEENHDLIWNTEEIHWRDQVIGEVRLGTTTRIHKQELYESLLSNIFTLLVVILVLIICTNLLLSRILRIPFSQLIGMVEAMSEGTYTEGGQRSFFYAEFVTLLQRFNTMSGMVQKREASLLQSNALLEQEIKERARITEERERLISELESKNAELERFTYTVSHDLKSPLITIKAFAGKLAKELAKEQYDRAEHRLSRVTDAADKMTSLLEDVLEISRIGRMVNPPVEISFDALAEDVKELLSGPIAEKKINLVLNPTSCTVYGDKVRFREAIQNLIENAAKFMGDQSSPTIEVGAIQEDGASVFYVRDNGIGIEGDYHDRVFGLFDQLSPDGEGTGVGLALVRRIVELHEGKIWIESEGSGEGTTFKFTLPLVET